MKEENTRKQKHEKVLERRRMCWRKESDGGEDGGRMGAGWGQDGGRMGAGWGGSLTHSSWTLRPAGLWAHRPTVPTHSLRRTSVTMICFLFLKQQRGLLNFEINIGHLMFTKTLLHIQIISSVSDEVLTDRRSWITTIKTSKWRPLLLPL